MNILLKPSRLQALVFVVLFVTVALSLLLLDLAYYWRALAMILLCFGAYIFKSQPVVRLRKLTSDNWEIEYKSGKTVSGTLAGNSISNRYFSILMLKPGKRLIQKSALVFRDTLSIKEYHRLRLRLRGLLN